MTEAIIVALIAGAAAILGNIIVSRSSTKELYAKLDLQSELEDQRISARLNEYQAATDVKLENLTREVREHNNFAQRIPEIEGNLKVIDNRVTQLERGA